MLRTRGVCRNYFKGQMNAHMTTIRRTCALEAPSLTDGEKLQPNIHILTNHKEASYSESTYRLCI
jgi:hypothetical protein